MADQFRLSTYIERGRYVLRPPFCDLTPNQPLILSTDTKGVLASDLNLIAMGYLPGDHAVLIKAKIKGGEVLMAKVTGRCSCVMRPILVWSEGQDKADAEEMKTIRQILKESLVD